MFHMNILLLCLLSAIAFIALTHVWKHRRYYYLGFKVPSAFGGLSGYMIVSFVGSSLDKVFEYLMAGYTRNGESAVFKFWLGPYLCVVPTDPGIVDKVLLNVLQKAPCYKHMSGSSGQGLIQHMHLPTWSRHRKIVDTSFQYATLKSYVKIFHEEACILADKLESLAISNEPFEPNKFLGLATLSSLMRSSFGVDFEIQQTYHSHHPYLEAVESSFQIFLVRTFKPWLFIHSIDKLFGYKDQLRQNRFIQKNFIERIIRTVKNKIDNKHGIAPESVDHTFNNKIQKGHGIDSESVGGRSDRTNTFVERILKSHTTCEDQAMTEKELLHEMVTLLNAGFDTIMITTGIVLNILALHQDLQQDVYHEIQNTLEDHTPLKFEQLQNLDLLTRVIKETMRMYPAAPIVARSSPSELQFGEYTIPADTTILIFIYGLHRDPRYWPDPDTFDPDRFLPSSVAKRHPGVYLPFSLGARNCIGNKYAMLQMKTMISTLLRRYRILPGDKCRSMGDIRFEFGMTIRPLPGNDIRLERRDL